MSTYLIVAAVSYLLGSIPFGYILVRTFLKQDIRATGSGNIGATNVGRTGHNGLAIATLLLDAGKGATAVVLTFVVFARGAVHDATSAYTLASVAALFAICGHVFTVWLGFKGGKGVATAVGAFALLAPRAVLVALAVFIIAVGVSRFVSLGSILGAATFPVALCFFAPARVEPSPALLTIVSIAALLVVVKHHANIRRLLNGTEHKFGSKPEIPSNPIQAEKNA